MPEKIQHSSNPPSECPKDKHSQTGASALPENDTYDHQLEQQMIAEGCPNFIDEL